MGSVQFFLFKNDEFKIDLIDHDTIICVMEIRCESSNMLTHLFYACRHGIITRLF